MTKRGIMTQLIVNGELQVGIPHNCPFRQMNEETGEIFCGVSNIEDCQDETAFPQKCPLLKEPIKVMVV